MVHLGRRRGARVLAGAWLQASFAQLTGNLRATGENAGSGSNEQRVVRGNGPSPGTIYKAPSANGPVAVTPFRRIHCSRRFGGASRPLERKPPRGTRVAAVLAGPTKRRPMSDGRSEADAQELMTFEGSPPPRPVELQAGRPAAGLERLRSLIAGLRSVRSTDGTRVRVVRPVAARLKAARRRRVKERVHEAMGVSVSIIASAR